MGKRNDVDGCLGERSRGWLNGSLLVRSWKDQNWKKVAVAHAYKMTEAELA